jgi:hypothetical protein
VVFLLGRDHNQKGTISPKYQTIVVFNLDLARKFLAVQVHELHALPISRLKVDLAVLIDELRMVSLDSQPTKHDFRLRIASFATDISDILRQQVYYLAIQQGILVKVLQMRELAVLTLLVLLQLFLFLVLLILF